MVEKIERAFQREAKVSVQYEYAEESKHLGKWGFRPAVARD